jgi:hypothetical protein
LRFKKNIYVLIISFILFSVRDISASLNINSSGSLTKGFASFCTSEGTKVQWTFEPACVVGEATAAIAKQQRTSKLKRTARPHIIQNEKQKENDNRTQKYKTSSARTLMCSLCGLILCVSNLLISQGILVFCLVRVSYTYIQFTATLFIDFTTLLTNLACT